MRILALDTSGPSQSVAVLENDRCLKEIFDPKPPSHSEALIRHIQEALEGVGWTLPEVDLFAVTVGPGSFTGLRIGISTIKGFCLALDKPVVGVSSLLAMAAPELSMAPLVVSCLDARCGEVYAGVFCGEAQAPIQVLEDRAWTIESFLQKLSELQGGKRILGNAWLAYGDRLQVLAASSDAEARIAASEVGRQGFRLYQAGKSVSGAQLQALYLRASEAENRQKNPR